MCSPPCTQRRPTAALFPPPEIPGPSPSVSPNARAPPPVAALSTAPASWLVGRRQSTHDHCVASRRVEDITLGGNQILNPKNWSAKSTTNHVRPIFWSATKILKIGRCFWPRKGWKNTAKKCRPDFDQNLKKKNWSKVFGRPKFPKKIEYEGNLF